MGGLQLRECQPLVMGIFLREIFHVTRLEPSDCFGLFWEC
jgi:hypothetical protein